MRAMAGGEKPAGGLAAVGETLRSILRGPGLRRGLGALRWINQDDGFDCPGCAWPEPLRRSRAEFCENGAKHLAHEATRRRLTADFFAEHPIEELLGRSDLWLESQGRLTVPLVKREASRRYEPIAWGEAYRLIAERLAALGSPDQAIFYTSGRASNEAAFLYQLFVRQLGTNNLPDCSNLCHESSGRALVEAIGTGKGTVGLEDFESADLILVIGQNPGSNHPRMLATLLAARRRGARILAINPLRERGLVSFAHPKELRGLLGRGTALADVYMQVRVGGDVALLKGIIKEVLAAEDRAPGRVLDHEFLREHTSGLDALCASLEAISWPELEAASGVPREEIRRAAELYVASERVIACWAMGLTQHRHALANIHEIVNLMLLRGNLGRPGAGLCPVRGHSNVQGDRTMGICERPEAGFLERLGQAFEFQPPSHPGLDSVGAIRAMADGRARVFVALGGNFAAACPDRAYTWAALRGTDLTVQISTKLNRSHLVHGREALILPCLTRSERDVQGGKLQFVTVENSMRVVQRSQGTLPPASPDLRSEPRIIAELAEVVLGDRSQVPWRSLADDYDRIRDRIARVVSGFDGFNQRIRQPGRFTLPSAAHRREFQTPNGRARFHVHPVPRLDMDRGHFLLMTVRSHDQFNTTIYSENDRYRGIRGSRWVLFMNPHDMTEAGLHPGQRVRVTSHFGGETRQLRGLTLVPYRLPSGCTAAYFPEANPLVHAGSFAEGSHTPAYKSIVVSVVAEAD